MAGIISGGTPASQHHSRPNSTFVSICRSGRRSAARRAACSTPGRPRSAAPPTAGTPGATPSPADPRPGTPGARNPSAARGRAPLHHAASITGALRLGVIGNTRAGRRRAAAGHGAHRPGQARRHIRPVEAITRAVKVERSSDNQLRKPNTRPTPAPAQRQPRASGQAAARQPGRPRDLAVRHRQLPRADCAAYDNAAASFSASCWRAFSSGRPATAGTPAPASIQRGLHVGPPSVRTGSPHRPRWATAGRTPVDQQDHTSSRTFPAKSSMSTPR